MKVEKIGEYGYYPALYGLGLSYNITANISFSDFIKEEQIISRLERLAQNLSDKDGGHNKFLESIQVWYLITAPIYFWSQFDTYRVGMTKQSQSTMHTLLKIPLTKNNFMDAEIDDNYLHTLNNIIETDIFNSSREKKRYLKQRLPSGFLQTRQICTNYKVLRNIVQQRKMHELIEWRIFVQRIFETLEYKNLL